MAKGPYHNIQSHHWFKDLLEIQSTIYSIFDYKKNTGVLDSNSKHKKEKSSVLLDGPYWFEKL